MKLLVAFALTALLGTPASANNRNPESPAGTMAVQVATLSKSPLLLVRVIKPLGQSAYLQVVDKDKHTVFSDRMGKKESTWNKAFHVSELPQGTYRLVVSDHRYRPVHEQTFRVDLPVLPDPEPRVIIP